MDDDTNLLSAYVHNGSEDAFETLTARYLDLVYSAALRQLRDADQARDVAQAVFLLLARKAKSLDAKTILSGWLYRTARFVSMEALRAEKRRKLREDSMARALPEEGSSEEMWKEVSPHLDEAMEKIPEADRTAIVLRYFEDRPVRELAARLGLSEEAAKKRVSRALEKLRGVLERRGIKSSSSLLGTALLASAVQPTPPALAAAILPAVGTPMAAALPAKILVKGTLEMMTYTKIHAGTAAAVILLMVGGTGYVGVEQIQARREHKRAEEAVSQKQNQLDAPSGVQEQMFAEAQRENRQLRVEARELYRLRDTVTQLRAQLRGVAAPPNTLRLQDAPRELHESAERLRELQYEHFVAAGLKAIALQPLEGLSDEEKGAHAFEINFMKNVGLALRIYSTDHANEFPPTVETLLGTDLLNDSMKEQLQSGKYEYIRFSGAEGKPSLPAIWSREPNEKGVRLVALNDGSVQTIREPVGVQKPGFFAVAGTK